MKKIALLLVLLLSFGAFVFAQEEEAAEEPVEITMEQAADAIARLEALEAQVEGASFVPAVSGSATMTFGVDLDTPTRMGFENSASADFTIAVMKFTETDQPEADPVGYIKVSNVELKFDDDDGTTISAGSVSAGILLAGGMVDLVIYGAPSLSLGNAAGFKYDGADAHNVVKPALSAKNDTTLAGTAPGTYDDTPTIVYVETGDTAPTGGTSIGSDTNGTFYAVPVATAATAAVDAAYHGFTANFNISPLTLSLLVASDGNWKNANATGNINDFAFGLKVSGAFDPVNLNAGLILGPTDGMDIGFTVGVDGTFGPATVDLGFDGFVADGGTGMDFDLSFGLDLDVPTKPAVDYYLESVGGTMDMATQVALDIGSMVDGLTFTETFQLDNMLTTLIWNSQTVIGYTVSGITPKVTFGYHSSGVGELAVELGLAVIENTSITLKYASDPLFGGTTTDPGLITLATTISL